MKRPKRPQPLYSFQIEAQQQRRLRRLPVLLRRELPRMLRIAMQKALDDLDHRTTT